MYHALERSLQRLRKRKRAGRALEPFCLPAYHMIIYFQFSAMAMVSLYYFTSTSDRRRIQRQQQWQRQQRSFLCIQILTVFPYSLAVRIIPRVDSGLLTHARPGRRRRQLEGDPLHANNIRKDSILSQGSLGTPLLSDEPLSPRNFPKDVKASRCQYP